MTAAEQILAYMQKHGKATRPELERVFGLYEKTVDSAIRKLERLGCIKRAGKTPRVPRRKPAVIFALTGEWVNPAEIGDCRGRPRNAERPVEAIPETKPILDFDEINRAMNSFFRQVSA